MPALIETSAPLGHLTYTMTVDGKPVAVRYQHVVTGLSYVTDLTVPMGAPGYDVIVGGSRDPITVNRAWVAQYRKHNGT